MAEKLPREDVVVLLGTPTEDASRLFQKFQQLEATAGADEDLLALKRKMGLAPPPPAPAPVRVQAPATAGGSRW